MPGYAATMRIERATVRRRSTGPSSDVAWEQARSSDDDRALERTVPDDATSLLTDLRERLGSFAEAWAQTTFYLTDPNSWR